MNSSSQLSASATHISDALMHDEEMACPLGLETTERLRAIAARYCDGDGGCHGPDHADRVHRVALYIGSGMNAKLDVLSAAALLHDIGRLHETKQKGKVCHANKGATMANDILRDMAFPQDKIDEIVHCIATHRYRSTDIPLSLEAKIIFCIGAIGIGRAFLFAGQLGAKLHNHNGNVDGTRPYSVEDTAYREFKVKMCKIKDRMLTPMGKKLALERHAFMEVFFSRLETEIYGPRHQQS